MHSSCGAPPAQEQYMASIPVGARGSFTLVVTAEHLANRFKDATLPPVLATPVMIMAMENAALNAIKPYLGAQESAVGTRVDVLHLAATPIGRKVVDARSYRTLLRSEVGLDGVESSVLHGHD